MRSQVKISISSDDKNVNAAFFLSLTQFCEKQGVKCSIVNKKKPREIDESRIPKILASSEVSFKLIKAKPFVDKYGNSEAEPNKYCCSPDCGCPESRLCMAGNRHKDGHISG